MARGKVLFKNPQEGDIKINPSNPNSTWIYTNGKWVYVKKRKPAKPKIVKTYNFSSIKFKHGGDFIFWILYYKRG